VIEEMELELGNAEVLILQCLDNNCFYLMDEDTGAMTLPTIGEKNVYHAPGPLVVAKDQQLEHLLNKLSPIFEWRPEMLMLLRTLWCRHLTECCCDHPKQPDGALKEAAAMLKGLGELRRKVKTWLVFNKFANVVLVDPMAALGATADAGKAVGMMADTVHLKEEGYTAVAQQCKKIITDWLLGRKRKAVAMAANPEAKKQKIESAGQTVPQAIAGTSGTGGRKSNQPVVKGTQA
jgi:hypothetical protein